MGDLGKGKADLLVHLDQDVPIMLERGGRAALNPFGRDVVFQKFHGVDVVAVLPAPADVVSLADLVELGQHPVAIFEGEEVESVAELFALQSLIIKAHLFSCAPFVILLYHRDFFSILPHSGQ